MKVFRSEKGEIFVAACVVWFLIGVVGTLAATDYAKKKAEGKIPKIEKTINK